MKKCQPPARISFNFTNKCNLSCSFCYMPFDRKESRFELWKKIVEMAYLWKIESITFGGGDPYVYPRFPDLLRYTYDQFSGKIFIQVDTNGMRMNKSHYRLLSETNSLLGLPLDGSTEEINEMIRSNPYIHRNTLRHLESLKEHKVNTKINTLVCNHNISDITNIAKILTRYDVSCSRRQHKCVAYWCACHGR